jgi:hypothetical protein
LLFDRILDVVVDAARWGGAFQHPLETVNKLRHLKVPDVLIECERMAARQRPHVFRELGGRWEACSIYEDGDDTYVPPEGIGKLESHPVVSRS